MSRTRLIATTAGIAALFVFAPAAQAVTCDELDGALSSAGDGDVVTLDEGQVCHGHFNLPDDTTITLQGGGTGATLDGLVTDGDFTDNVQILSGENVGETLIQNLMFSNGDANDGNGGAINVFGDSPVTIADNHFTSNVAERGGAVAVENSFLLIKQLAGRAAGVRDVTLSNNTFSGNGAFDRGGAAYIDAASPVDITGNEFTDNASIETGRSGESGGGIYVIADGALTLADNTFARNTATARGGGATARLCSGATVTGNTFDENKIVQAPRTRFCSLAS